MSAERERAMSALAYLAACALDVCENEQEIAAIEKRCEVVRAALRSSEPQGWQPIASAPRDGTMILLHAPVDGYEITYVGFWGVSVTGSGMWWIGHDWGRLPSPDPTHWMPLPAAPVESVRAPLTQNDPEK